MKILWIALALAAVVIVYIRLAPSDPGRWHVPLKISENRTLDGGVERVLEGVTLAALNEVALQTPRTSVLAGSVEEGRITYITRSFLIGFPDYTTVAVDKDRLLVFARLRFGRRDFGVNRQRIDAWIAALQ